MNGCPLIRLQEHITVEILRVYFGINGQMFFDGQWAHWLRKDITDYIMRRTGGEHF